MRTERRRRALHVHGSAHRLEEGRRDRAENGPGLGLSGQTAVVDEDFPQAKPVILVCDNLNTHTIASLDNAFVPEEARRIARRLEIIRAPKRGSWLNMAEIELPVLSRAGPPRRIPGIEQLRREVSQWVTARNQFFKGVAWRLATEDARFKLASLYPRFVA